MYRVSWLSVFWKSETPFCTWSLAVLTDSVWFSSVPPDMFGLYFKWALATSDFLVLIIHNHPTGLWFTHVRE